MNDKEIIKRLEGIIQDKNSQIKHLEKLINTPEIQDFVKGVMSEAAHQRARFGEEHDLKKSSEEWFWTLGYLSGKALNAQKAGNTEKFKHHIISSAALLANYHRQIIKNATSKSF